MLSKEVLPPRLIDIRGKVYGRLTVYGFHEIRSRKSYWYCECICGNKVSVRSDQLKSGRSKSCGCITQERVQAGINTTHGLSKHPLYAVFHGMKRRCYLKTSQDYIYYGGRGIRICEDWLSNFESFYEWALSSGYERGLSIDRIDVNGNYEPSNCRWVTMKVQNRNTRQNNVIEINGKFKCLSEWCEHLNISLSTVKYRVRRGWDVKDALLKNEDDSNV